MEDFEKSLDWHLLAYKPHKGLQRYIRDLNRIYRSEPAFSEVDFDWKGFEWIDFHDIDTCIISFVRKARHPKDFLVFVCNFTPVPRLNYRVGVPETGYYGKQRRVVKARSVLCYWGARELGISAVEISKKLNIASSTASESVTMGRQINEEQGLKLLDEDLE